MMFGFFDSAFSAFSVIIPIMFVLVFGGILVALVRSISQWHKNNNSPRLTVSAAVVSKRMDVTRHHNPTTHTTASSTQYYATFQVESGDRFELSIPSQDYGYLVEGDHGQLQFQGTRFLGFTRS